MKPTLVFATLALAMTAFAAVEPVDVKLDLPAAWKDTPAGVRDGAIRAAELDGMRLLAERVYGIALTSDTTVYDLVLHSDDVRGRLRTVIAGVKKGDPKYVDDGSVRVVCSLKLREVFETITRTLKEKQTGWDRVTIEDVTRIERECKDTVIDVMGNAAAPGTRGERRLQAKRAAELDAYRKLAERVGGVEIAGTTTVRDFMLKSDVLQARMAQVIKGAQPKAIRFMEDNSCEVDMALKLADVTEVVKLYAGGGKTGVEIRKEVETQTFTETGRGAARLAGAQADPDALLSVSTDGAFKDTQIVIKRYLGRQVVVE